MTRNNKEHKEYTEEEVVDIIAETVADYDDVSLEYMLRKAHTESRFNPRARNPSGAAGLYQIMPFNTAKERQTNPDFDPYDPYDATMWTCEFTERNAAQLQKIGAEVEDWLLYLAHQQGAGGLSIILRGASRGLSIGQLEPRIKRNVQANIRGSQRGKITTCKEFLNDWRNYYNRIELSDYAQQKIEQHEGDRT